MLKFIQVCNPQCKSQVRFVTVWKTSEADNEKRRQMAAAAQKAAAQKQVAEAAELAKKNAANARQNMQTQVSVSGKANNSAFSGCFRISQDLPYVVVVLGNWGIK